MIKITVVIPSSDLFEKAAEAFDEYADPGVIEYKVIHAYGTRVDAMDLGGADIVVARGLTQQAIARKYNERIVLDMPVSAYDILQAIFDCKRQHSAQKIAVLGTESILFDRETLQEIIGVELALFKIDNEQGINRALDEAESLGFDAIVGGLTACLIADERGVGHTVIRTGVETLRDSIREAVSTAMVMFNERAKAELSNAILQNSKEAIMYFDADGVLALHNRRVHDIMNFPPGPALAGQSAESLFRNQEIAAIIRKRQASHGLVRTINGTLLVSDHVPVKVDGHAIGTICTFQRANDIQAVESKIRKELNRKGLVAKYGFEDIIHASSALAETIAVARKYAHADSNVLLLGETGTGKELFAQSIHRASGRQSGPFVAVNCAAFSESLLESDLFGYTEGAFTGAVKGGKTGLFELAHGGTLFLDEVGEIPMSLQATLLRALQEREIRRIGDDRVIPIDVRVIAATNHDLREKVSAGKFRMDLLYRLDVLSLGIPPLRSRREDIVHIAKHYFQRYREKFGKESLGMASRAWQALESYDWPGNTRELRNICERLVVLGEDNSKITKETVQNALSVSTSVQPAGETALEGSADQHAAVETLMQLANLLRMNRADLADTLGMSRTTLWRKMNKKGKPEK